MSDRNINLCLLIYSGYLLFSIFIVTNLFIWQENETKQRNPLFKFLKADHTITKKQVPSEEVSSKHHKLSLVPTATEPRSKAGQTLPADLIP